MKGSGHKGPETSENAKQKGLSDIVDACRRFMEKVCLQTGFDRICFILHYGSSFSGEMSDESDIDICFYYAGPPREASRFRLRLLSSMKDDRLDIQVFQQLPIRARLDAFKGEVLYSRDDIFLYDMARRTYQEYEDFRHRLEDYLGVRALT